MRTVGCKDDDMSILIAKKFIIPFETGIVVIKHWKIHNYIQKDRYVETKYKDEKSFLELDSNNAYRLPNHDNNNPCIHYGYMLDTQVRLGKDRIGKDRLGEVTILSEPVPDSGPKVISLILNTKKEYPIFQKQVDEWQSLYPAVEIISELRKMLGWLNANPTKRKTKHGILRFVNNWLAKQQDKGHVTTGQTAAERIRDL
jgi:hypothetical protein